MNFITRKIVKEKDIFKTCDLYAIRNNNDTYFIMYNRNGVAKGTVKCETFKEELIKSYEPIILNVSLFHDKGENIG